MPIEKIPGAAPPGRIGLLEKEGRNQKELTQADIRQVSRAMTEEYIDQLRTLAYEDAKTGACRQGGYLDALMKAQWEHCILAGHAKAVSEAVIALNKFPCGWQPGRYALNVSGQSYAVIIRSGAGRAKMLDEGGENIFCFHRCYGTWQAAPSDAETQFYWESDRIYLTAYEKVAGGSSAQEQDTVAGFDMREK